MNIYAVGGAIRDELLGVPALDRDYVVVGATPEQMVAQGYRPVGKDFPVFLHPQTHEEYALARTERKTAAGYHGFQFFYAPDVTLEEDLARRDLTINAMARQLQPDGTLTGPVIDPFNGQGDLQARVFRHVSDAFLEDPVRILRVARFAARFTDFTVAPQTLELMQKMVSAGEVDALVKARAGISPQPQTGAAPQATSAAIPPLPSGVPPGSQYSPSRKMWRDPTGKIYDSAGAPQ